jgi:hypothetical protein
LFGRRKSSSGFKPLVVFQARNSISSGEAELFLKEIVEGDLGIEVERMYPYDNSDEYKLLEKLDSDGGGVSVPFYYNRESMHVLRGTPSRDALRLWAKGKKPPLPRPEAKARGGEEDLEPDQLAEDDIDFLKEIGMMNADPMKDMDDILENLEAESLENRGKDKILGR